MIKAKQIALVLVCAYHQRLVDSFSFSRSSVATILTSSPVSIYQHNLKTPNMQYRQHGAFISRRYTEARSESAAAAESNFLISNESIDYSIASINLSDQWLKLVQNDQVSASTTIPSDSDSNEGVEVTYGVRLHPNSKLDKPRFMEFVEAAADKSAGATTDSEVHSKIAALNATLAQVAGLFSVEPDSTNHDSDNIHEKKGPQTAQKAIQLFRRDGDFVAQLQIVRTLRPSPSPGFASSPSTAATDNTKSYSTPPPYDPETDSFVTGPLRLELRPLVARIEPQQLQNEQLSPKLTTSWDIFHNISPCDVRGHFLLLPDVTQKNNNWRPQSLTECDCYDLVQLTSSIEPVGGLLVSFNSVGAGASQNHIHCHVWPCPPVPLISLSEPTPLQPPDESVTTKEDRIPSCASLPDEEDEDHDHSRHHNHNHMQMSNDADADADNDELNDSSLYAASRVDSIYDFVDIFERKDDEQQQQPLVQVSYLNYPCFCVELSSVHDDNTGKSLDVLSKAVWTVFSCLGTAPHNVCMSNRNEVVDSSSTSSSGKIVVVDVKIFVRSRERSPTIVPATKLGASEMMGVFHCQSLEQLEELVCEDSGRSAPPPMVQALQDVSYEDTESLWHTIRNALSSLRA